MISRTVIGAGAALVLLSAVAIAFAQSSTVTGAGGAATGAVLGGPVGAAVGGDAGAAVGTGLAPPPRQVVTYVRRAPMPPRIIVEREKIAVGRPLPRRVAITPVSDNSQYGYAVVNNERVIVEPSSRKVIQVLY